MENNDRNAEIIETRREVYGDRAEIRRERLTHHAGTLQAHAENVLASARSRAANIPFGQPILVGHHSEGRDRNYRAKIHTDTGKAFALMEKADKVRSQAGSVGSAISSDDPDALVKLRAKLDNAKSSHEIMLAANKAVRAHKNNPDGALAAIVKTGMPEANARELLKPDYMGRVGFPAYVLSNSKANIYAMEQRIKDIERTMQAVDVERVLSSGVTYREDVALNRVMLCFNYKPDADARAVLKARGFRWAPSNAAWQRQLNNAGRYAAQQVIDALGLDASQE